jgi:N-methylhydantoinase A
MHIGVDIGGTFTDLVLSEGGQLRIHKLLSTPDDPARAMLQGLAELSGNSDAVAHVSHGSTVATNAILERRGARCALITTQGFRDLLFIGRQNRPDLYALQPKLPPPLIPRQHCYEVPERLDHTGAVLVPLDLAALDRVIDQLQSEQIEAVAVCFLYSFVNPAHEQAVRARLIERGILNGAQIALSSDVLPEFREYERASTVALEAYVRPVISRYLTQVEQSLPKTCGLRVMKSDGGIVSADRARERAVLMALSGPAAGVIGAFHIARMAGLDRVITLDMGGTSTDVALCPGALVRRAESEIDGLPLRTRMIDIETVGAGGGSIARIDSGGALRVGPESAGANPGPIIYGLDGSSVTVSDANAVLARLDADHFLGGSMPLQIDRALDAITRLGSEVGMTARQAAAGIIRLANANVERAVRRVSVARGFDPRNFTLVAFGGAGPLHACEVAAQLQIKRVLIPRYPGVLCALGLLVADVQLDFSHSVLNKAQPDYEHMMEALLQEATAALAAEGVSSEQMQFMATFDARYRGQAYELSIPYSENTARFTESFHQAHRRAYGHAFPERSVEIVNLRLQAVGLVDKPTFVREPETQNDADNALFGWKDGVDSRPAALYERAALTPGACFQGPALVFQLDCTSYVPARWTANVDGYHNLILTSVVQEPS